MNFRRIFAVSSVALLALAGCSGKASSDASAGPSDKASSSAASPTSCDTSKLPAHSGEKVKVDTSTKVPTLSFPNTAAPKELTVQVIEEGTGAEIGQTDFVVVKYVGQVWCGSAPFDSSYSRNTTFPTSLTKVVKGWAQGLAGHRAGAKLVVSIPPGDLGYPGGRPESGIGAEDTMTFYIEVLNSWSPTSAGQADAKVEKEKADLPVDYTGEIGQPIQTMTPRNTSAEIKEAATTVIARGTGEEIKSTGTVYLAYRAVTADGQKTMTTWMENVGPQAVALGKGSVFDSLVGLPVGSRVLLEVPARDGGNQNGGSSAALYVVADILGYFPGS